MALKDLAVLYGRIALVILAFAFVAGIIVGPVLQKAGLRASVTAVQDRVPGPELIRAKTMSAPGGQG